VSHLIQSIVVTIALVAGATAHARTSTYEFVGDFYSQDFNWHVSSARFEIKVSSTDYGSPVKLERLEIYPFDPNPGSPMCMGYHRCLPRFVATGFRNIAPPGSNFDSYQATIKNWSYFSYVHVNVSLDSYSGAYVSLVASDKPGPIDDSYQESNIRVLEVYGSSLKDISPSNTVDIATIKLDGKRLTMKLQDRLGSASGDQQPFPSFVIDTLWMGHGHTNLYIPTHWREAMTHRWEVFALNVETISGPTGDQTYLSVSYRVHDSVGEIYDSVSESLDLRVLLGEAFVPNP
jgi:hypothetical protein